MIKNYFLRAAAMFTLLCGALAVSCSNEDNGDGGKEPGPGPGPKDPIAATYSRCEYKGDFTGGKGTDFFNLVIATGPVNASGEATGEGYIFNLNLNSLQSGAAKPIPANGTYNYDAGNSFAANTISANMSKATGYDKALKATPYTFSAAQVIVTKDGENFKVSGEVTLNTGTKIAFTATVTNWVDLTEDDGSDVNYLAENLNLTPEYRAPVEFLGSQDGVGIYRVMLAMSQQGPFITIYLLGPEATSDTAAIPTGTFQMNDSFAINTAVSGSYDEADDMLTGSFYEDATKKVLGLPVSGTVTVTNKGLASDNKTTIYNLVMDTKTAENYTIKVTYEGDLPLDKGYQSTLDDDYNMNLSSVTGASAFFLGDAFETQTGTWIVQFRPTGANKDGFSMIIFSPSTEFTFPTGTFSYAENFAANTFSPAEQDEEGVIIGTYYFTLDAEGYVNEFAPAAGGTIKIEASGANSKFTFDVLDDAGNKVTGTWTGPVTTQDVSEAKAPAKAPKYGNKINKQMSNAFSMKGTRASIKSTLKSSQAAKFELAR